MMRPLNRIQPAAPAAAYKTYAIKSPVSTHMRPGTCVDADCEAHALGWRTTVDETTELGQKQAYYIRKQSGRKCSEERTEAGLTVFAFEAGQTCFNVITVNGMDRNGHWVPLQRPENFLVLGGDHRGNPMRTPTYRHSRPEFWVEDFQEAHDKLRTARERG